MQWMCYALWWHGGLFCEVREGILLAARACRVPFHPRTKAILHPLGMCLPALLLCLQHLPLTLKECYQFCLSPTDPDDGPVASALLLFATAFARR